MMCEERINKLANIGFNWTKKQSWDEKFEELKLYKAKCGHTNVPQSYTDQPNLERWVRNQRQGYRNYALGNKQKSQGMCKERVIKLDSIGFNWGKSKQHI
mmetsp:Transcript_4241/g.4858  ORF Transcript_4241/g.4858 Transcript_4241/m.4858 type:complete len:100 (-) Transcript_4241:21-320(-)